MDKHANPTRASDAAPATREQIAALANEFWKNRGCPEGTRDEDWFRAERELAGSKRIDEMEAIDRSLAEQPTAQAETNDPTTLRFPVRSEIARTLSAQVSKSA
jgi:hypothetical protein